MVISILHVADCPNWQRALEAVSRVAAEVRPGAQVSAILVESDGDVARHGFRGSPTILIDGIDPFFDPDARTGLSCRVYLTPNGMAGRPTDDQIRAALS